MPEELISVQDIITKYGYKDPYSAYRAIRNSGLDYQGQLSRATLVPKVEFDHWFRLRAPNQHTPGLTDGVIKFPDFKQKRWTDYWELTGDWIVAADFHVPFNHMIMCNRMLHMAKLFNIKRLLVAGDFFDELAYSHFVDYDKLSWPEEKRFAREIGIVLFSYFDEVRYLMGNHDNRMFKQLGGRGDPFSIWEEVFFREATNDWVSLYNHCFLTSGDKRWYITHPDTGGKTASWLKARKEKYPDCNILGAHTHKSQNVQDGSGKYRLVALPGMQDNELIGWKQRRDDADYVWSTGFAIIKNGFIYVFEDGATDWGFWERLAEQEILNGTNDTDGETEIIPGATGGEFDSEEPRERAADPDQKSTDH